MEELCREIGQQGRLTNRSGIVLPDTADCGESSKALALLLLNDHEGARTAALEECMLLVAPALQCVGRKKSKALMLRTDALLDQLAEDDEDHMTAWVVADWTPEDAEAVALEMAQMRILQVSTKLNQTHPTKQDYLCEPGQGEAKC